MKKKILSCVFILALLVSCVQFEENADRSNFILLSDSTTETPLSWTDPSADEFLWYCYPDNNPNATLYVESDNNYTVPAFGTAKVQNYYCVAKKDGVTTSQSPTYHIAYTGLPIIYINTNDGNDITKKTEYVDATISIITEDENSVSNLSECSVQIKGRGASSWTLMTNKSYNLKFPEAKKILNKDIAKKDKRWCMTANQIDKTEMANWSASYLGRKVFNSIWEPAFEFANLVLNGEYKGLYLIGETIKISEKRVNLTYNSDLSDISELTNDGSSVDEILSHGGYILEITDETDISSFCTTHGLLITFKDPDLQEIEGSFSREQIVEFTRKKVNRLEAAIMGDSEEDYTDLMDLDSMVDWFLTNVVMNNPESEFKTSCYFQYNPDKGKFFMGPNWDFDRAMKKTDDFKTLDILNLWYKELVKDSTFCNAVIKRWKEVYTDSDKLTKVVGKIDSKSNSIHPALIFDSIRWGKEISEANFPKQWLDARISFLDSEFSN